MKASSPRFPALLISTATGIIVTRAAAEIDFGGDLTRQLVAAAARARDRRRPARPLRYLRAAAAAHVPDGGDHVRRVLRAGAKALPKPQRRKPARRRRCPAAPGDGTPAVKPAEIGRPAALVRSDGARDRLRSDSARRRQPGRRSARAHHDDPAPRRARTRASSVPPIRVRDNLQLQAVNVRGQDLRPRSRARGGHGQPPARDESGHRDRRRSTASRRPNPRSICRRCGSPESGRGDAEMAGYTVIDPTSVIATHLTELIKSACAGSARPPRDVGAARQRQAALPGRRRRTRSGAADGRRSPARAAESLARADPDSQPAADPRERSPTARASSKDIDFLTERVRVALARHICAEYAENGLLSVITVDPRLETLLGEAVRRGEDAYALLDPKPSRGSTRRSRKQIAGRAERRSCSRSSCARRTVRLALKRLTERAAPRWSCSRTARSRRGCASSRSAKFRPPMTLRNRRQSDEIFRSVGPPAQGRNGSVARPAR